MFTFNTTRRRRIASLAALAIVGAAGLSACGGSDESSKDSKEFTYWSMWDKTEPQAAVIGDAIEQFTKDTGIKVNVEWQGREVLNKLAPTLAGKPAADLVDQSQNALGSGLVANEMNADMSPVYKMDIPGEDQTVGDVIPEGYLDFIQDKKDNPYMVPYTVSGEAVFFDKAAHPEISQQPPATWDELMALADKLKSAGTTPFALDADSMGTTQYWVITPLVRAIGVDAVRELASDKSGKAFDDPKVLATMEKIETLVKGGYFGKGYNATVAPAQQQKWANGERVFNMGGTWIPSESKGYAKAGFDYDSFQLPVIDATTGSSDVPVNLIGFGVPKNAEHLDAAEEFIAYFMNKDRLSGISTETNNLTPRTDIPAPAPLAAYADALSKNDAYPSLAALGRDYGQWFTEVFSPANQAFLQGQTSAKEWVEGVQKQTVDFWKANG